MNMNIRYLKTLPCVLWLMLLLLITACSNNIQPMTSSKASLGALTQVTKDLLNLPPPREKIVLTLYKFKDQTGQYKANQQVVTYSTAVTQGATSMLIKALKEAGNGSWFRLLERESIANLLNERKIIQQTRTQYSGKAPVPALPPLLYSPLILDGGIVSYQSNLLTGGVGAKYLGIGGDASFQRDSVGIYLRSISVQNGEILQSIDTSKTIFSIGVDLGVYKFVGFQNLLEIETGFTSNEPSQMAVLEAIEKAVHTMIVEGVMQGMWQFKDPKQGMAVIAAYLNEKNNGKPYTTPEYDVETHSIVDK